MCGIAGFHLKNPKFVKKHEGVERLVDKLLLGIESRGKHATGFVAVTVDGRVVMDKNDVTASEFIKDREKIPVGIQTALLHTRWATQGPAEDHQNNHPVLFGSCFATHNGHINNDDELFKEFEWQRTAAVDSIVIPALVDTFGWDKIGEALEKLKGNMATAIIDPVKHPKELVLARGQSSPLVIIENENFIMWGSLATAIREAWATVLGTPPELSKFEHVKEGTIIRVNDTETSRESYTVTRPFGFQKRHHGTGGTGGHIGPLTTPIGKRNGTIGRVIDSTEEVENAVTECRKECIAFAKSDDSNARRWSKKEGYTKVDFLDLEDGVKRWIPCYGCGDLVINEDMRETLNWGKVCLDCHGVVIHAISKNAAVMQDTEEELRDDGHTLAGTNIPRIPTIDRDALEGWSDRENELHNATLKEMVKRCGSYYTAVAIQFLCFLTTPEYKEYAGASVKELIDSLRDMYEETYMSVAEDAFAEDVSGTHKELVAPEQPHPLVTPRAGSEEGAGWLWVFCSTHEKAYKRMDGCSTCNQEQKLETELDQAIAGDFCGVEAFERPQTVTSNDDRNVIALPRCPECKTYVLRVGGKCAVCEKLKVDAIAAEPVKEKCAKCGHKARVILTQKSGHKIAFCKKHFKTCWSCKVTANHILPNGERVCHLHVRGVGGALSDTTLIKRGITITEVK